MKISTLVNWRALTVQLVSSFVLLVLLTAIAVGIPAILLIQSQSETQAWAQVEQGHRATQALLAAWQKEIAGLALLTAQRPALPEMLNQESTIELESFLSTLREGTELDLLLICNAAGKEVAQVGNEALGLLCSTENVAGYYVAPADVGNRLWLLAAEQIDSQDRLAGFVIVGVALDDSFARQMKAQTGLEHNFFIGDELIASSFMAANAMAATMLLNREEEAPFLRATFTLNGRPFYAAQLNLSGTNLVDEVALEVTNITRTQQRVVGSLIAGMSIVALVGSIVGILLARGLGRPLRQLTEAASSMSRQELDTKISVNTRIQEVTKVAQALEIARVDLNRALNELRQTNAWNDHLLESISEGIVVLDVDGRITFFSPGAERITGHTQQEVLDRKASDVFHLVGTDEPLNRLLPQQGQAYKITLELSEDRQTTLAITSAQLSLPSIGKAGTAIVFRDISDSERIHQLLGQFLGNITHEFRTPLSALAVSIELLMDQVAELTAAELQELLNSLHLGILGLQSLIDNLLESASLEAGRFRVYPRLIHVDDIIRDALNTMNPLKEKFGHQFALELPVTLPIVLADPRRITQVMINLLSNAIKYSPDGSEIVIRAVEIGDYVRVIVADRGPGVPPGYRPNLFRRLVHPNVESNKAQYGVGLGLSVVKAIVEAHNGQVGVEDRPHGGSRFWFTVPKGVEDESIDRG